MAHKYTTPCPHCGAPMERKATVDELALDMITAVIGEAYEMAARQTGWPGSLPLAKKALRILREQGIKVVDAEDAPAEFVRGYIRGLQDARIEAVSVGSPIAAKLTQMIETQESKV